MTKKELITILSILACNYKNFDVNDEKKLKLLLETYYSCLADIDYNVCIAAVKKIMIESPYPPNIHSIRQTAIDIVKPSNNNSMEIWNEVFDMISNGLYMTQEKFNTYSTIAKKFVGSIRQLRELSLTDSSIVNTVVRGQFFKQYEIILQREKQEKLLPINLLKELSDKNKNESEEK